MVCSWLDGHTLCDSVAIMHYLDETRPEHPLLPADPVARAKVREIVEIICSGIQPLQNRLVLSTMERGKSMEWADKWISRGFRGLEKVLSTSSGKYCVGDSLTMADCCLVPQVFNAKRWAPKDYEINRALIYLLFIKHRYKVNLAPYPNILRLVETLENDEVINACHPHRQTDCPEKLRSLKLWCDDDQMIFRSPMMKWSLIPLLDNSKILNAFRIAFMRR